MNNERAWTRAQRAARASYMNPKRKKKRKSIQIRQHNKTKLKHNCKPSQVKIVQSSFKHCQGCGCNNVACKSNGKACLFCFRTEVARLWLNSMALKLPSNTITSTTPSWYLTARYFRLICCFLLPRGTILDTSCISVFQNKHAEYFI